MTTAALTEYVENRYGLSADALRSIHNHILVSRATARRCYRRVQDLVPDERTPQATTNFYVALGEAVRDAGSFSGSYEEFV